jgi:hypothetical protein
MSVGPTAWDERRADSRATGEQTGWDEGRADSDSRAAGVQDPSPEAPMRLLARSIRTYPAADSDVPSQCAVQAMGSDSDMARAAGWEIASGAYNVVIGGA